MQHINQLSTRRSFWKRNTQNIVVMVGLLCAAGQTKANTETSVLVHPEAPQEAYQVRYSQAVLLTARLLDAAGAPIVGRRVSFFLQRAGDESTRFLIFDPFTAADGVAAARLAVTAGSHGQTDFVAGIPSPDSAGEPYEVVVRFTGDVPPSDPSCSSDAGPSVDGGVGPDGGVASVLLCPSEATSDLFLAVETTSLVVAPGNEGELGSTLTLIATVTDPNGDAPASGDAVDGSEPKGVAGVNVDFFYDLDQNGSPSLNERIGTASTNSAGQAVLDFTADPALGVVAGLYDRGIHAQFGGSEQYGLSGGSAALNLLPGAPDAARTLLQADVTEVPADGFSVVNITATLVDVFNNPLGIDAPPHNVDFTASLGSFDGNADFDPLTGDYQIVYKANIDPGVDEIQVVVDDQPGTTLDITLLDQPFCGCDSTDQRGIPPTALALLVLWGLGRRRWRARQKR